MSKDDAPARWFDRPPWKGIIEANLGLFETLLIVYLLLLLMETLREGFVTRFLPLNALLAAVVATGVIASLTMREEEREPDQPLRTRHYLFLAALALGSWLILWYKLSDLGWIQYPVSIIGGLLVGLVGLSMLMPEKGPAPPKDAESAQAAFPSVVRPTTSASPKPLNVTGVLMGTTFLFSCPHCSHVGRVEAAKAGEKLHCATCRSRLVLHIDARPKSRAAPKASKPLAPKVELPLSDVVAADPKPQTPAPVERVAATPPKTVLAVRGIAARGKIAFACPSCGRTGRVPEGAAGKRLRCNECGATMRVLTAAAEKASRARKPS